MCNYLQKKYANHLLKPFLGWYLQKPREFRYDELLLTIYPTVFHPAYFFSTRNFAEYIRGLELKQKTVVEVGAGSGLLSFIAIKKGAAATAIEVNELAVKGLNENAKRNNVNGTFSVIHSDLFDAVPLQQFDYAFINPPYFFKAVASAAELAWNCGPGGEYFEKLFRQLKTYVPAGQIYMSLAENCDLERIKDIAAGHGAMLELTVERKIKWEKNFIFKVKYDQAGKC